eukprot:3913973-Amphidinium_carterae.1
MACLDGCLAVHVLLLLVMPRVACHQRLQPRPCMRRYFGSWPPTGVAWVEDKRATRSPKGFDGVHPQ